MQIIRLTLMAMLLVTLGIGDAMAGKGGHGHRHSHGHGVRLGFVFGPYWGPWYAPPYTPPIVVEHVSPPVYIERGGDSGPANYWYYCRTGGGYYPYIKECPGGWQKVAPQPQDQP